jgi:hypothetical protein
MAISELNKLKKENKQLKGLLKNAVELLAQSRALLTSATKAAPQKRAARKKTIKKT